VVVQPRSLGTIYVENGVGRSITNFLNAHSRDHGLKAVFQNDYHPQAQHAQQSDVWWIEAVGAEHWHVLTRDLRMLRNPDECAAIVETGVHMVAFHSPRTGLSYNVWDMVQGIARHWDDVAEFLVAPEQAGMCLEVFRGPTRPRVHRPAPPSG
jgi:PIN like domain